MRQIIKSFSAATKVLLLLTVVLFYCEFNSCAQTTPSNGIMLTDTINTPETWGPGVIDVYDDILITDGGELTILPGTQLVFQGNYKIDVIGTGRLLSEGTAADSIVFTVADTTGFYNWSHNGWGGIRFGELSSMSSSADSSFLKYCLIEYGKNDEGGAMYLYSFNNLHLDRIVFQKNYTSEDAGAIYIRQYSKPLISNCIFRDNRTNTTSIASGGAVYIRDSSPKFHNCLFYNNQGYYDGAVYTWGTGSYDVKFINCTFSNNKLQNTTSGGALYLSSSSKGEIINCIFTNNEGNEISAPQSAWAFNIENSCIEGGLNSIYDYDLNLSYEGGDFYATCNDEDPLFMNPVIGYGPGSSTVNGQPADYRLQVVSPCIDNGTPDTTGLNLPEFDILNNPRITNLNIDMGAYECIEGYNLNMPSNLQASVNSNDVTLTWSAASGKGLLGYAVYREYLQIESLTPNTSYQDIGLSDGLYQYFVTAIYDEGESWPDGPIEISIGDCHGGIIDDEVTWGPGEIKVCEDIIVSSGGELIILPGTQLTFQDHYSIEVLGTGKIKAEGLINDSILFTVTDTSGFYNWTHTGWGGIAFGKSGNMLTEADSSILKHCCFEFGHNNDGGALFINEFNNIDISNNLFQYNHAFDDGGAIYLVENSSPRILNCIIRENYAEGKGGGIRGLQSSSKIIGCLFYNNKAYSGGAIAMEYSGSSPELINSTISSNLSTGSGYYGGAIHNAQHVYFKIINSVIYGNDEHQIMQSGGTLFLQNSCIQNGPNGIYLANWANIGYEGDDFYFTCIETDPVFSNPTIGYGPGSITSNGQLADYGIEVVSSCIDVGTADTTGLNLPDTDLANNPRITNNTIDMGAYERYDGFNLNSPSNSQASVIGGDVSLTWAAASAKGLLGYSVYRDYVQIESLTTNTNYMDIGLLQGLYDYHVTAIYDEGESWPDGPIVVSVGNCHGGIILENVTWGPGEINVCEDVLIPSGGVLTIMPGTELNFQGYFEINITGTGRILAEGTSSDSIVFTVADTTGFYNWTHEGWGGLRFGRLNSMSAGADSSKIKYCVFEYSKSDNGGALYYNYFGKVVNDRNTFQFNYAVDDGGAIHIRNSTVIITNSNVSNNSNSGSYDDGGGGLYAYQSNTTLINSLFFNNYSHRGGAIYIAQNGSTTNFINNTICNNYGSQYAGGIFYTNSGTHILTNNILFGNNGEEVRFSSSSGMMKNCCIDGGPSAIYGTVTFEGGDFYATCTDSLPKFINPVEGSGPGSIPLNGLAPDYRLFNDSPCINAGTPDTTGLSLPEYDLAGEIRIYADTVDMGAYESDMGIFQIELELKAFLSGPYLGTGMIQFLNLLGYLPNNQPYGLEPWNFGGNENVTSIPNNDIIDWIYIEMRRSDTGPSGAISDSIVGRRAAFISNNGEIIDLNGSNEVTMLVRDTINLYAAIYHRNHLPIVSSNAITGTNGIYSYDFTTGPDKFFGGTNACIELSPGVWGMIGGNAIPDNQINNQDKNDGWLSEIDNSGYYMGDLNMNGTVEDTDKENTWEPNVGRGSKVPE